MINLRNTSKRSSPLSLARVTTALLFGTALLPAGCTDSTPVVVAPPPPAYVPPPPPPPSVKSVEQLMAELSIDPRIELPEQRAPATTEARVAVLEFFDSIARGDDQSLGKMLSSADKQELDELVRSGQWKDVTGSIKRIQIQTGQSPGGDPAALAVIEVGKPSGTDYQPQLWYYQPEADSYSFIAVATPPGIMDRLSGEDLIEAWHRILAQDMALADKPDEAIVEAKVEYDKGDGGSSGGGSPGESPGGANPGGGGPGMPGKAKKPSTPYQPPHP